MVHKLNSMILAAVVTIWLGATAQATTYYWDINGTTANTGTTATETWNSSNVRWNLLVAGNGTAVNGTTAGTSANDLVFDTYAAGAPGSGYTAGGTVATSSSRIASSVAFQGNGPMIINSGMTLTVGGTGARSGIYVLSGSANNTFSAAVALATACTFQNAGSGLLTIGGAISSPGNQSLTVNGSGNTTISSVIGTGTGTLTKSDGGILTLSGSSSNTFTGLTTVSAGELDLAKTGTAIAIAGNLTINGGTVKYTAAGTNQIANTRTVTINGASAIFDLGASHSDTVATVTLDGGGQITGTGTSTLTVNSANTFAMSNGTVSAILGGSGALNKTTANTVTLSGGNTYTGVTTIIDGTLSISGSINASTTVNVNGGLLSTTGVDKLANAAAVTVAGGTLTVGGADTVSTLTMSSGAIGGSSTLTATTYGLSGGTVTGNLGTGTINSSGAVALNGTAGALTVNVTAGTLTLGSADRLADGAAVTVSGTGILDMSTFADAVSIFNMSAGSLNGSGTLTATTYGLSGGTVTGNLGGGTMNVTGAVALDGTAGATAVNVTAGTLTLGSANRLADGATVAVSGGTLDMAFNDTVGAVTLSSGTISGVGTLTGSSYALTNTGTIGANLGSSTAGLTKTGAGTATLSGNNAYSGATTVSNGTLLVNGNQSSATGAVTVASGATLGGSGTIGGAVTVSGTLSPGNSPGTLNVGTETVPGSVTMAADSIYEWEFDGTAGDKVAIQGNLALTSGWKLALVDAGGTPTQDVKYDLFTYTGSLTGSLTAAINYGDTGWSTARVGQEAGKVYLMFGPRSGVLLVAGSPGYDPDTQTGLKDSENPLAPPISGVNNSGTAVGSSVSYVSGADMGPRAVRWDASGAAATELGNLGTNNGSIGSTNVVAYAVNDDGTAVGYASKFDGGVNKGLRAVRWDASGAAATELGNLGTDSDGITYVVALAVNDAGTAVGRSEKYVGGVSKGYRAVRWDPSGDAATELGNLGTDSVGYVATAEALAVNSAGKAVGSETLYDDGSYVGLRAVRWDASGAATELGNLGGSSNRALAINDAGTAVGYAQKNTGVPIGDRAVRWDASGTAATELGNLGTNNGSIGYTNARARAVNAFGMAVGYAQKYDANTDMGSRAVRWDASGTAATELGNLGTTSIGYTTADAYAVNGAGSVVGYAQKYDANIDMGSRAVIWLPGARAKDLNDLGVAPVPDDGGTWTLTLARAISADGWVAGTGTFDPDGGGPLAGYIRHWVAQVGLGGTWTKPAGGTWGRGPNWSTGTPAMQVGNATFNLNSVYAVALDRDELTKNIAINAGTVTIDFNGNTLTAESGLTIAGGATLKGDGTIVGDIFNSGTLGSTGTIAGAVTVNAGGHLAPGAGIGILNVGTVAVPKSLTMAAGSIYDWELGSTSADKVVVTGNLTLADGWKLTLVDAGGAPKFADKFDLFSYTMGTVSLGSYNIDSGTTGWDVSRASIGTDGGIVYITGIAGLPGDANDDGVIDAADYIIVKQNFGMTSGALWSDGNFDGGVGTVDWADLQILLAHFGTRSVGGAPAAPEPGSVMLLMFGAAALLRRRSCLRP